jgi:uncharacterized protein YbaR (Trm112 family)
MHRFFLNFLCCPACRGTLTQQGANESGAIIQEGLLCCAACGGNYQVIAGIPVLLLDRSSDQQQVETTVRDHVAQQFSAFDSRRLLDEVSRHHYVPTGKWAAREFTQKFQDGQWILDIGTGWGWHWMGITTPQIIAMDLSLEMLLVGKRLLGEQIDKNVHLVCADAAQLPLKNHSVDGIWSIQCLQHIPPGKLERCLQMCSMIKKKEAPVELYWVNWNLLDRFLHRLLGKKVRKERTDPFYFRMITEEELRDLLSKYFPRKAAVGYNEVLFHPELRLRHCLPLAWLDRSLSLIPYLNRCLARQVVGRIAPES